MATASIDPQWLARLRAGDKAACAACIEQHSPGVYRLAVRPPFGTWGGGSYVVLLTVTKPMGNTVEILVPIDIPF